MNPKTFLINFIPDYKKETPAVLRNKKYADELLSLYDLGEVIHFNNSDYKEALFTQNPFFVVVDNEYTANEIKEIKPDTLIYYTDSISSIFSRKAEVEEKKKKQQKLFKEIEGLVKKIRESGEKEIEDIRKFASMDYKDLYETIKKALIGDDENLRKKAWDLLFGEGERHSNIIWMRVQLMAEMWEKADWEGREKLMCMSMERHTDQGTARKMDDFTDENGLKYHQYMFIDPYGDDTNHIRRLPFATKGQDRYSYENLLEKNEIPTNYMRVQLEASSLKEQYDKYIANECNKMKKVLEEWGNNPLKTRRELCVIPWDTSYSLGEPLVDAEVEGLKSFIKKHSNKENNKL